MEERRNVGDGEPGLRRAVSAMRVLVLVGLILIVAALAPGSVPVRAQGDTLAVGAVIRVVTADGEPLDMRAGPALGHPLVARLAPNETVTVIAEPQSDGVTRWVPVRTSNGLLGWIPDQYIAPVVAIGAEPVPSPAPELAIAEAPLPPGSSAPLVAASPSAATVEAQSPPGGALDVEARVKYPEAKTRRQEITVWVTRAGQPVQDATVTVFIEDDDDEPLRVLKPTDIEGRTWRELSIPRAAKGSVQVVVSAVALDGGTGQTEVSYFIR
jgi:uncharacterized protein YgiM (DUF1202 family)